MNDADIYKLIGNNIRNNRKAQGLTIQDISNMTDMDWSFLARIETGKGIPSIASIQKIAKALNIELADIFTKQQKNILDKAIVNIINSYSGHDKKNVLDILKSVSLLKKRKTQPERE